MKSLSVQISLVKTVPSSTVESNRNLIFHIYHLSLQFKNGGGYDKILSLFDLTVFTLFCKMQNLSSSLSISIFFSVCNNSRYPFRRVFLVSFTLLKCQRTVPENSRILKWVFYSARTTNFLKLLCYFFDQTS